MRVVTRAVRVVTEKLYLDGRYIDVTLSLQRSSTSTAWSPTRAPRPPNMPTASRCRQRWAASRVPSGYRRRRSSSSRRRRALGVRMSCTRYRAPTESTWAITRPSRPSRWAGGRASRLCSHGVTCRSRAGHVPVTCRSRVGHVSVTCSWEDKATMLFGERPRRQTPLRHLSQGPSRTCPEAPVAPAPPKPLPPPPDAPPPSQPQAMHR